MWFLFLQQFQRRARSTGKCTANSLPSPSFDVTTKRAMPLQDMFDDGQPQPRAASGARTPAIHPVKTFGQTRDVLRRDAKSGILHSKDRMIFHASPTSR